jgi:hypothetical protein
MVSKFDLGLLNAYNLRDHPKIQQTKMLVTCQRFGELSLFGLIWQYSSNHKTYNKGRFKVVATLILAAVINFEPTYIICFVIRRES